MLLFFWQEWAPGFIASISNISIDDSGSWCGLPLQLRFQNSLCVSFQTTILFSKWGFCLQFVASKMFESSSSLFASPKATPLDQSSLKYLKQMFFYLECITSFCWGVEATFRNWRNLPMQTNLVQQESDAQPVFHVKCEPAEATVQQIH